MFDANSSKLAKQVQKLEKTSSGEELSLDARLLDIYDKATTLEVPVGIPSINKTFSPEKVKQLIDLFKDNIDASSAEQFLAIGVDVGLGLYSLANFQKDPSVGLYLTYRVCAMPFIGYGSELYLGVYEAPPDYDDIFLHGVYDVIYLDGNRGLKLTTEKKFWGFFSKKTSRVAKKLFGELK